MRRLMWLTLGFAGACGLCAYLLPQQYLGLLAGVCGLLAAAAAIQGRKMRSFAAAAWLLLGCCLGAMWFGQFYRLYLKDAVALDGKTQTVTIRVTDYSDATPYGSRVDGTVAQKEKRYQVRVYLKDNQVLEPGHMLTGEFRCRVTTPDGKEEATYHKGRGTFLLLYQKGDVTLSRDPEMMWSDRIAQLRKALGEALERSFPGDTVPFAKALLLGDTRELDYQTDTDLKISGIRHVVAVSGQHVSILFALLSMVTFRKRFLTAFAGMPVLLIFAALAGFTPSVNRSCLMLGLMLLSMLFEREYDGPTALAFAALVMLAINPLTITDIGFQLSAGSVAGIYAFVGKLGKWITGLLGTRKDQRWRKRLVRWLSTSISTTLSAMAVTTPLCALYFGAVSLVGVVTNLLTLWIISLIFYGILLVCLLFPVWEAAAVMAAQFLAWPIRYVLHVAERLADFPLAAVYTRSEYIAAWLALVYVLLGLFLLMRSQKPWILISCAALGLCAALTASYLEPMLWDTSLTVLDVGQGQCLLLQSGGRTYMVDCGGDSDTETADIAASTLLSRGITRLDGLILTHLDRDHAGAAANLLSRVDTELLILPPERTELAGCTAGEVVYAAENLILSMEGAQLRIFTPDFPGNGNESSLCLLFDTEKCDILITGDRNGFGERSLLRHAEIPEVDILIAGHHGSKNATCQELLAAVQPETVCISVGRDNPYGHPAPELLQRLEQFGCKVYRTDWNGDIWIRR